MNERTKACPKCGSVMRLDEKQFFPIVKWLCSVCKFYKEEELGENNEGYFIK